MTTTDPTKAAQEAAMWARRAQAKQTGYSDPRGFFALPNAPLTPRTPATIIPSHAAAVRAIEEAKRGNVVALAMLREVAAGGRPTLNGEHVVMRAISGYLATVR